MRLVFAGTPEVALPSLQALAAAHEVIAVVTRPDAPRGRSKKLIPSPVAKWASDAGIEVLKPGRPGEEDFVARLLELAPDACPVVAYGALLPQKVLSIPRYGWVNLHFSLLPRWRGAAPVQRAIMAGDEVTGATTFRIVSELDAGPVYGSLIEPIYPEDTAGDVLGRLAEEGAHLLLDTITELPTAQPVEQSSDGVTLAPKLSVAEARIEWTRPAAELDRLIRGCSPEPMSWTTMRRGSSDPVRFRIAVARPASSATNAPGVVAAEPRRVLVGTGAGDLELLAVQPAGKQVMAARDWARGLHGDQVRFE